MVADPNRNRDRLPRIIYNGDHMTRRQFHLMYCDMPDGYRAELIGGVVFEPSPVSSVHSEFHLDLGYILRRYSRYTPGVRGGDNGTVILSDEDEVQPDLYLRFESGGNSKKDKGKFIVGAPELVAEVAYSNCAIDLHLKKQRYAMHGAIEYLVVCLNPEKLYWFNLKASTMIKADSKGIIRSQVFPGLWIHEKAFFNQDDDLQEAVLERGLNSLAHRKLLEQLS